MQPAPVDDLQYHSLMLKLLLNLKTLHNWKCQWVSFPAHEIPLRFLKLLTSVFGRGTAGICRPTAATAAHLVESGFGRKSVGMLGPQGRATQLYWGPIWGQNVQHFQNYWSASVLQGLAMKSSHGNYTQNDNEKFSDNAKSNGINNCSDRVCNAKKTNVPWTILLGENVPGTIFWTVFGDKFLKERAGISWRAAAAYAMHRLPTQSAEQQDLIKPSFLPFWKEDTKYLIKLFFCHFERLFWSDGLIKKFGSVQLFKYEPPLSWTRIFHILIDQH